MLRQRWVDAPLATVLLSLAALAGISSCHDAVPLLWKYDAGASRPSAVLATRGYVAFGNDSGVTVLSPDGDVICSFDAHGSVASAPKTDGRLLYFGSSNHVFYAMDSTCKQIWKMTTGGAIKGAPELSKNEVYFASGDGHLYSADSQTGALRWTFPGAPAPQQLAAAPPPQAALVAAGSVNRHGKVAKAKHPHRHPKVHGRAKGRDRRGHHGGNAMAENSADAVATAPVASPKPPEDSGEVASFGTAGPTLADGVLYVGNTDHHLYAVQAADGVLQWRFDAGSEIAAVPVVASGKVYFGTLGGTVYALDAKAPKVAWKLSMSGAVRSRALVVDKAVYVAAQDKHLYVVDGLHGDVQWKFAGQGEFVAPPAVLTSATFMAGGRGDASMYGLRADHSIFWRFKAPAEVESEPVVFDNRLFVASTDGSIFAFNLAAMDTSK